MCASRILVIACGALANELVKVKRLNDWSHVEIKCLPAELHNRPERIVPAVETLIKDNQDAYDRIVLGYADCGTGGGLDALCEIYNIARIPGAHCYEFFTGGAQFEEYSESEPGTFYLTDYLARNFERLIVKGMGIDRHPEIKTMLFGNYRKLIYLAQSDVPELNRLAESAAAFLGLDFERVPTGLEPFQSSLQSRI